MRPPSVEHGVVADSADDDPTLAALREAAREIAHIEPRWLALAEGKLAPAEAEILREEAAQTEDGRLLWGLYELFAKVIESGEVAP